MKSIIPRTTRRSIVLFSALLAGPLFFAWPAKASTGTNGIPNILLHTFARDIARMVYEWDPVDGRSRRQREQALCKFMYEGYRSSAWIPQSSFDNNRILQLVIGNADAIVGRRIGLVLWPQNQTARAYGMAPNPAPDKALSWTLNCVGCHMTEINGVAYFGGGSKVLDEKILAETVEAITSAAARQLIVGNTADADLAGRAHEILKRHHHGRFDSLTRGRSTAFPASHVELYLRAHGGIMPTSAEVGRGDVKTPPLWHTTAKLPFGRWYCDGSFRGQFPLMASSMELALDHSFDGLVNTVLPTIKDDFEKVLKYIRPPRYPYAIDFALARKGKDLFYSDKVACYGCHGVYDGKGGVQWTGVHVDVGTDPARRQLVSAGFIAAFEHSPLAAEGNLIKSTGYAATPLTGVWANYPYLHNGSVPTLFHLLGPQSERPIVFSVWAARNFDPVRVGQVLFSDGNKDYDQAELLHRFGKDRDWFNVDRDGCDNRGHDFWSRIETDENRQALIEYLKTI
jgi:hypothetical protein